MTDDEKDQLRAAVAECIHWAGLKHAPYEGSMLCREGEMEDREIPASGFETTWFAFCPKCGARLRDSAILGAEQGEDDWAAREAERRQGGLQNGSVNMVPGQADKG